MYSGIQPDKSQTGQHTAMNGQAALPDLEDADRISQICLQIGEQHVPQTGTYNTETQGSDEDVI